MTETTSIIFRIDAELKKAFEEAAKDRDRTASQLLRDYVRHFVDDHHKRNAQKALKLDTRPTLLPASPPANRKPKKGQKLAAAKPGNWRRDQ